MSVKMRKDTYFYIPDHLGSTSMVLDADGNISQSVIYIPYGEVFVEERNGAWNSPYLFNAKELDPETGFYYYGARYLNPTSGMWLSVDPLWEKNIDASPYSYCHGNPVKMIDPDGRDEEQRTKAINRAKEYVEKNPRNNNGKTSYMNGAKGGPGEKVDCSGLVSNCVVAGDEKDPNHGNATKGTVNMWNNTTAVDKSKIVIGNMIFFGKEGKKEYINHVGLVSNITYDKKGNIKNLSFIASNSSTGPDDVTLYKDGKSMNSYWVPRIVGYRKWDAKPDSQINHKTNANQYSSETINKSSNNRDYTRYLNLKKDLGTLIRYIGLRR